VPVAVDEDHNLDSVIDNEEEEPVGKLSRIGFEVKVRTLTVFQTIVQNGCKITILTT